MRVGLVLAAAALIGACASIAGLDSSDPDTAGLAGDDDDVASSNGSAGKPTGTSSGAVGTNGAPGTSGTSGVPGTSGGTSGTSSGDPIDAGIDATPPPPPPAEGPCKGPMLDKCDDPGQTCHEDAKCHNGGCQGSSKPCGVGQDNCCRGFYCPLGIPLCKKCIDNEEKADTALGVPIEGSCCSLNVDDNGKCKKP